MSKISCSISFFLLTGILLIFSSASAQISILPHGLGISLGENENADAILILVNDYEEPVAFSFKVGLIEDDEEGRGAPLRDDAGELLRQFNSGVEGVGGMCFDGELLWAGAYTAHQVVGMTLEGDMELMIENVRDPISMTFDGEVLWISDWSTPGMSLYDLEGNILEQFNMNFDSISGMASDREQFVFMHCNDDRLIHVISIEDHREIQSFQFRHAMNNADIKGIEWVPDHQNGQLWGNSPRRLYQAFVDDDWNVEAVSNFAWNTTDHYIEPAHDGENMWHGSWEGTTWYMYDEGVSEFNVISFDPRVGVVPGEDSIPIEVFFTSTDMEAGVYNSVVFVETETEIIECTIVITIDSPSTLLICNVTDAETGEVMRGVNVSMNAYDIIRTTNRRGECEFEQLPVQEYLFTFQAEDYLPLVQPLAIEDEGEQFLEIEMLHADCVPSIDNVITALRPGDIFQTEFSVFNEGNGPLTFVTDKRLLGDANAEPWELRRSLNVSEFVEDPDIQGVVFFDQHFYIAGSNNRDPAIYVLNRDGQIVDQFNQFGITNIGYRDLGWDGDLIWGSGERHLFGFTPEGELIESFNANLNPCTNIAWDKDREILWISSTTANIFGFDRDGNLIEELPRYEMRTYGLSYWPDDPDGYQLYVFHKIARTCNQIVTKMNVETGDTLNVAWLDPEAEGNARGCFITNVFDNYSWVFMASVENDDNDRLDIWQVDARKEWMEIDPEDGVIEAGEEQNFVITLDAAELPEVLFEGEIVFVHDGVGTETVISISLEVGDGGGWQEEEMNLTFDDGWNIISAHVQPDPDDVVEIMSELVDAGQLILMKNGNGEFYNPAFNFNNIPGWRVNEGYMVNVENDAELIIQGEPVNEDDPLPLNEGWQITSYYPRRGIDAVTALAGIVDVLLLAKDVEGRFYNPAFNFSNMGDMIPGQGYLLNLEEATELVYNIREELAGYSTPYIPPSILPIHENTGENMSLLVLSELPDGEVGVLSNNNIVGSGVMLNGKCGIAVWGDDPTTSRIDGAVNGEMMEIMFHSGQELSTVNYETFLGNGKYTTDGFQLIHILNLATSPEQYGIVEAYPNPFNSTTSITINLPEVSKINLGLFDLTGRIVADIASGTMKTGLHTYSLEGSFLTSGVYIVQLQSSGGISKHKLTLLK